MRRRLFDFLKKAKRAPSRPPVGKVEIFSRHCLSSEISKKKKRPVGFSRERCFRNLLDTSPREEANITVFLDRGEHFLEEDHFLKKFQPLITVDARSEAAAFLSLAYYIASLKLHPDTILYLVEDDYLHRPGWISVLKEAFLFPSADYVTLYDHADKYDEEMYPGLKTQLYATKSSHWRTTPSTTHTFATRFSTFLEDLPIHMRFSENRKISDDHQKFLKLGRRGRMLLSSVPGFATHMDPQALSPTIDWTGL